MIDTHQNYNELVAAGMPKAQAEAVVRVQFKIFNALHTDATTQPTVSWQDAFAQPDTLRFIVKCFTVAAAATAALYLTAN